ncbi:MAG: AMP-binding protein [Burkholderiaceae bacterium]|nr:AMP-binding protein [Burkholderiaceae bacterium]
MEWTQVTLGGVLREHATARPDHIAIADGKARLTYRQFDRWVDELAHGMQAIGLGRGDQVALWMINSAAWVACWIACTRIGATLVPINTRYKLEEVEFILRQSDAKALITLDQYWNIDFLGMLRELLPELETCKAGELRSKRLPRLRAVVLWKDIEVPGTHCLESVARRGTASLADGNVLAPINSKDPIIIVYTSGTTGHPKGAMHSHIVLRNCANMARWMHTTPDDVVLGHMPFYHVAGAFAGIGQALFIGCTLVTLAHWVPDEALDTIEREQVTIFGGIPTHFIDCLDSMRRRRRMLRLKTAWIGGAPVTPEVAIAAFKELGLQALQCVYGMTETTSMTTLSEFDAPLEVLCDNKGKPIGDFEVKVCDPDTGEARPNGVIGEIWVRGHIVMMGYYRDSRATAEVMTGDGWFRTGDLGVYDEAGYLKVTGRLKEMFIVGGSNAYPSEIERVLQTNPKVKQAIVVGVPNPRLGEVGYAFVELQDGEACSEEEIIGFCRDKMADYKVPRYVKIVSEFQRTSTGKIQRSALANSACESLAEKNGG